MAPTSNNTSTIQPNGNFCFPSSPSSPTPELTYAISDVAANHHHHSPVSHRRHHERTPVTVNSPTQAGSSRGMRSSATTTTTPSSSRARHIRAGPYPHTLTSSSPASVPGPHTPPHHMPSRGARASNGHQEISGSASRHNAPSSAPDETWGSRAELSAGRRRLRGVSTGQNVPGSSVAPTVGSERSARKEEGVESTAAGVAGSGSSLTSSEAVTAAEGSNLTERNVRRTSDFYEYVRRERDKEGEPEGESSREGALRATLDEVNEKMRERK